MAEWFWAGFVLLLLLAALYFGWAAYEVWRRK